MDTRSASILRTLHPQFRPVAEWFVQWLLDAGIPVRVISGRRSVAHNIAVGGAPRSWHLAGLAFDLQVVGADAALWGEIGRAWEGLGGRWGGRFGSPRHFDTG